MQPGYGKETGQMTVLDLNSL